ncbi:MAG TPA: helix-turn-helix transcriptional regulator [Burkholderiales bacterium]|jgi:AcrR family transcriptional regulator
MALTSALIEVLKRELKARDITYADVAKQLDLSEASVKRMFSTKDFMLSRLDEICEFAGIEFADLARAVEARDSLLLQLTLEQEKELAADPKLMLAAVACIHHLGYEQILEAYTFTPAELVKLLTRLDKLKIIELAPNNRIRPLVAKAFTWLPAGPIQTFFYAQAQADFFRSRFDGEGEALLFASGRLSKASAKQLADRLKRTAQEFRDAHHEDLKLPLEQRPVMSVLLALRPWELPAFRELRKKAK